MKRTLKRQWKIHLIHHTHLDIGYTHTQDEVLRIQNNYLETAMDLVDRYRSRKTGEQFKWNPEITWALAEWLKTASDDNIERLKDQVTSGHIGIDALFGNLLTGLCRPEEMMANFNNKTMLEKKFGILIDSAMITDIPGWNWGFVTALAQHGVKYLSIGTNRSDRIGHILKDYADKPFYWQSPSGEKVLTFIHGKGYSWFHRNFHNPLFVGLMELASHDYDAKLSRKLNSGRLSRYLSKLEKRDYPYDTAIIRYNIGADNGPPDKTLADIVQKWNLENPEMQLIISTTSQAMKDFEKDYGSQLKTLKGDITPYWEDGAASTARETALARNSGEKLIATEKLAAMFKQPVDTDSLWKDILLFNEHTWGAYNSISKPDHPFAISQWDWKKSHVHKASDGIQNLLDAMLPEDPSSVTVYNTHSWKISQAVRVKTPYNTILDENGTPIPVQRLNDGSLLFFAKGIEGLSSRTYKLGQLQDPSDVSTGNLIQEGSIATGSVTMKNNFITLSIDESTGTVSSIIYKDKQLIKSNDKEKFNQLIFAVGKLGQKRIPTKPKDLRIAVIDNGPLQSTIRVSYQGIRGTQVHSDITMTALDEHITITNTLDRAVSRRKEGLHFEFPFELPDGKVHYDVIYGHAQVDRDQLKGSNKNFITATRWFDVSDEDHGMACCLIDAPLFKSGKLIHDPIRAGDSDLCGWIRETDYNGTVYSYVMNNYWMTNYKADQPGVTSFKYVFKPHGHYDEIEVSKFALAESQPLIAAATSRQVTQPFSCEEGPVIVTSLTSDDNAIKVRLWNTSGKPQTTSIKSSQYTGSRVDDNDDSITLSPYETKLIHISH